MGSVARSCSRRFSSSSPRSDADNGVSTKPGGRRPGRPRQLISVRQCGKRSRSARSAGRRLAAPPARPHDTSVARFTLLGRPCDLDWRRLQHQVTALTNSLNSAKAEQVPVPEDAVHCWYGRILLELFQKSSVVGQAACSGVQPDEVVQATGGHRGIHVKLGPSGRFSCMCTLHHHACRGVPVRVEEERWWLWCQDLHRNSLSL